MKKYWILLAAALLLACNPAEKRNVVIDTPLEPPVKLQTVPAATRDNYQIYQVNTKLYGNSGRLKAIQARLDDIKALGTDIVYLMPIYTEGTKKAFGSPYAVKDYKAVNSACGSLSDLKDLVKAAHSKGMKVMLDWVPNHTAWDNAWISEHPDWYKKDGNGNIIAPNGWSDVAQLDYSSEGLQNAMLDAMKYWIAEADIDGYRCDYANGVADAFWQKAIPELKAAKSGFLMLAEADLDRMFTNGFDIIYDWDMQEEARKLINGGNPADFVTFYSNEQGKTPAGKTRLYFVTNHDKASENSPLDLFRGKDGTFATYALLAALNASPMIYGSQEAAYPQPINFFTVTSVDWKADPDLTARYKNVLSELQGLNRDSACTFYASDRILYIVYEGSATIGVNLSNSGTTALLPDGKTEYKFGAYEVKIWK